MDASSKLIWRAIERRITDDDEATIILSYHHQDPLKPVNRAPK